LSREISKPHEEKVASIIRMVDESAYVVKSSGACDFHDGDVKFKAGLVECKTMKNPQKQQTIKKEDLEKLEEEVFRNSLDIATLAFNFGDLTGKEYFIVEETDFINMLYAYLKGEDKE